MQDRAHRRRGGQHAGRPGKTGADPGGKAREKLIQVSPMGNVGNRMIQYMVALALGRRVPGARLVQIHLPEWGIQVPPVPDDGGRTEVVSEPAVDLERLAGMLNTGALDRVDIRTYGQRLANFLPCTEYRTIFVHGATEPGEVQGAGPDELLCNIRQGDVLDAHHPDYVLVPVQFYADVVAQTGLRPVFAGQLEDTPYLQALRERFPDARFVPSRGAVADFAMIRASSHIVPAVSTFSWLAAWLSDARSIHLPVLGLLNPAQYRATDLLPLDDPRYRFTAFPHHYAVPVAGFAEAHRCIHRLWRQMRPDSLRALLAHRPPPRDRDAYLAAFDEGSYLRLYRDVAAAIAGSHMLDGRHHFTHHGFAERRQPFAMNGARYCMEYPIAAIELAQGEAWDPVDHWIRLGRERGYQRFG